jgi:hypothetical protein
LENQRALELNISLENLSYSSLSDFFIANPTMNYFSAAKILNATDNHFTPIDLEQALRRECYQRRDFHFFARITLYTALTAFDSNGWRQTHYILAGHWAGMLGEDLKGPALQSWHYLKTLNLPQGWKPVSIFDPILDDALQKGFSKE